MKILHLQTSMPWSGNAAFRLHLAMRASGIDSQIHTFQQAPNINFVSSDNSTFRSKVRNRINNEYVYQLNKKKIDKAALFSFPPLISHSGISQLIYNYDVIYLHWICGGYLSLDDIRQLGESGKPIIFFMHDAWLCTAGCHYMFDCRGFTMHCNDCPLFNSKKLIRKLNQKKEDIITKYNNFHFVSPSNWLTEQAKQSTILSKKKVFTIGNVVDETIFKPICKQHAREILNIPLDKYIISFGCQNGIFNRIKGWEYFQKAINSLEIPNCELVVYGCNENAEAKENIKYPIRFMGQINDEHKLALIDSASDLFVSPSLAESFGLTYLENTLCGTPIIGFDCTSIPEMIHPHRNGLIAKYKDSMDLAKCIKEIHDHPIFVEGRDSYSTQSIINKHIELIKSCM